jgi:hypothetical protein
VSESEHGDPPLPTAGGRLASSLNRRWRDHLQWTRRRLCENGSKPSLILEFTGRKWLKKQGNLRS